MLEYRTANQPEILGKNNLKHDSVFHSRFDSFNHYHTHSSASVILKL
jgi:hypothetical protein